TGADRTVAAQQRRQAQPEAAARSAPFLGRVDEPVMRAHPRPVRVRIAAEEISCDRKLIQPLRREAAVGINRRQRLARFAPAPPGECRKSPLELLVPPHGSAVRATCTRLPNGTPPLGE